MRGRSAVHVVLGIVGISNILSTPALGKSDPNDPNKYLNAVWVFADNVGEANYERDMLSCRSRFVGLPSFGLWQ
jgi:hypothetical protein